jgi:hypothetical protein
MKRIGMIAVAITVVLAAGWAVTALAPGDPSDEHAAIHTFDQATYVLEQRQAAILASIRTAILQSAAEIDGKCPGILARAPRGQAFGALNLEALMTPVLAGHYVERHAIDVYIGSIEHLSWSNRTVARLVRTRIDELKAELRVAPPDPCADMKAWIASQYAHIPPTTARFDREFPLPTKELPEGSMRVMSHLRLLLAPAEDARDKAIVHRTEQLEHDGSRSVQGMWSTAATRLTEALGLDPSVQEAFLG